MIKVRTFRRRADAEAHRTVVVARYGLPRTFRWADVPAGVRVEWGKGRHVEYETIIAEEPPPLRFATVADVWLVEAGESEARDDDPEAPMLVAVARQELVAPDEAPVARGGKGRTRPVEGGQGAVVAGPRRIR